MNRITDFVRFIFISPELVWVGGVILIFLYLDDYVIFLGQQLKGNSDIWKSLYALPFGFLAGSFKATSNLRAPLGKDENKILYEWPLYSKLTDRANFSLILGITCCIGIAVIWVFSKKLNDGEIGTLYLILSGVPGISAFILFMSQMKLKEILTKYT